MMIILPGIALVLVAALLWVRIAPSDPVIWHQMPPEVQTSDLRNSAVRVVDLGEDGLVLLDATIRATARTEVLAGAPAEGMMTYVTRSALFGFPDYTTIRQRNGQTEIFSRARFGRLDFGVNAARIDGWLEALAQG